MNKIVFMLLENIFSDIYIYKLKIYEMYVNDHTKTNTQIKRSLNTNIL